MKRCLGLPGDTATFRNNEVYVNRSLVEEDTLNLIFKDRTLQTTIVPRKGDTLWLKNIPSSLLAPIAIREGHEVRLPAPGETYVDGKKAAFYIVEQDHYFMVGDNLFASYDSRDWGTVPYSYLIAKATLVLLSWNNSLPPGANFWEHFRLRRTLEVVK